MLAEDLYCGVMTWTAAAVSAVTIRVGMTIARLRRHSVRPSARTSSSPSGPGAACAVGGALAGRAGFGVGTASAAFTAEAFRLNNMTDSNATTTRGRNATPPPTRSDLIMVSAGLTPRPAAPPKHFLNGG